MNLLKVVFLVTIAASLVLLLSNQATALDHPWDDQPTDTTTVSNDQVDGQPDVGNDDDDPNEETDAIVTVRFWFHWIFGGLDAYLVNQRAQQADKPERGSKNVSRKVMLPIRK